MIEFGWERSESYNTVFNKINSLKEKSVETMEKCNNGSLQQNES
jgi:hypothetical protein